MPNLSRNTVAPTPDAGFGQSPGELGFAAWTQDPATCSPSAGVAGVAGTLQLRRFSVSGLQSLTTLFLAITTGGVALTNGQCFAGVWDGNGTLIGLTGDQSVPWATPGLIAMPLVAGAGMPPPPVITETPFLYVGHWWNAGTSGPGLVRGIIDFDPNGAAGVPAAQATCVTANAGLTNLASTPQRLGPLTKDPNTKNWYAIA